MRFLILATVALVSSLAIAAETPDDSAVATSEYKVHMESKESRLMFGLYGQMTQFERQGLSLMGSNLEGIVDYAIRDKLAVQVSLAQSIDLANGFSILFTGLRLGAAYAWKGAFIRRTQNLMVNGDNTLAVQTTDESMTVFDVGIDQYLFNGTDRIVPATGISFGARYDVNVWGMRGSAMVRLGQLVISEDPVMMITAGVGMLMRF